MSLDFLAGITSHFWKKIISNLVPSTFSKTVNQIWGYNNDIFLHARSYTLFLMKSFSKETERVCSNKMKWKIKKENRDSRSRKQSM